MGMFQLPSGNECSWPQGEKAPNTFHRHRRGFCKVHSFENKIAFYEAIPFLFHLSSRFAENNLNFMQQQLQGSGASFPSHKQAWLPSLISASQQHPPHEAMTAWSPECQGQEWGWEYPMSFPLAYWLHPTGGLVSPKCMDIWSDPVSDLPF